MFSLPKQPKNGPTKSAAPHGPAPKIPPGEARSSVFLDSCSTGKKVPGMGPPLAQLVANSLPGVEVHAFEDLVVVVVVVVLVLLLLLFRNATKLDGDD